MRGNRWPIIAGGILLVSSCAHSPPPPMLSIARTSCDASPDMQHAQPIAYNGDGESSVSAQFDEKSACLKSGPDAKSLYKIYRLPDAQTPYSISIVSVPTDVSVFVPRITILDAKGTPVREIARDSLTFRSGNLSALFRSHANDSYLLLASDVEQVGKNSQQILETTKSVMLTTGTGFFVVNTGSDRSRQLIYSHNGSVEITLAPIPTAR